MNDLLTVSFRLRGALPVIVECSALSSVASAIT